MDSRGVLGRAARARGLALEDALDAYHAHLLARGDALVRRVGTPVKVLGKVSHDARGRNVFKAAFDGPQGVDFVGIMRGGYHVAIEAKSHAGDGAWDCGIEANGECLGRGAIKPAQWAELRSVVALGGCAFVILAAWGSVWRLWPFQICDHVRDSGRRTFRQADMARFGQLTGVEWYGAGLGGRYVR